MSITIYVKTLDGKTFEVDIDERTSVADLKAILQVKTGVEAKLQKIVYFGVSLNDQGLLMSDCGKGHVMPIGDNSTLQMYQRSPAKASLFGGSGTGDDGPVDASEPRTMVKK